MSETDRTDEAEDSDESSALAAESTGLPFYSRLAIGGLLTIVAMMAVLAIVQVGSGDTSGVAFIIIVVAIVAIVAGLVWRFGAWALVLGAIAGLLGTGLVFGSYLITAASNVNSVFDFGVALIGTVGSVLVLVGSIVAFVQLRRGAARTDATSSERNVLRGIAAVVAVIVVISGVATLAARDTVEDSVRAESIEVLMKTIEFRTETLEAKAGEMLRLVLKNDDLYIHTFTIDELDVDATVGPRGEKALSFVPSKAGTFEYKCAIPGHESMKGTLTVS